MSAESADPVDRVGPWRQERSDPGDDGPARWLPVGTRSSGALAMIDPAGLVGPVGGGWSLDWWVGADDRWHLPARETAVRQALVEQSPVVETRLRVPGGDIVHRAHAAQGPAGLDGREAIVVELTNETSVPVALALAIRPYAVDADGSVRRIVPHDKHTVGVDDGWTLVADRDARKMAVSPDGGSDPLAVVTRGAASESWAPVEDDRGRASLVLIFPLPHTATMRVAIVAGGPPDDIGPAGDGAVLGGLPWADAVASGWAQQADHGLRAVLPDGQLGEAFTAARRRLLLVAPDLGDATIGTDQALVARALAELGHHDELRPVVGGLLDRQRLNGAVPDGVGSEAATGAAMALVGWWWRHDPRPDLLHELAGPLAKAAHSAGRRRAVRRHRKDPKRAGLLPEGPQPVEVGGPVMAYLDDWWSAAGLLETAAVLSAAGQSQAAADAERLGRAVLQDVDRSLRAPGPGFDETAIPAGPDRPIDGGIVGLLPALGPLGVIDGSDTRAARTIELIRSEFVADHTWVPSGCAGATPSAWLTACLALYELAQGDDRAIGRLDGLARAGGSTTSWPGRPGGGGDDPLATALFALLVRELLFRERRGPGAVFGEGLDILAVMPPSWLGQGIEVHDAPTTFGRFGFAVRWHGERPALLWELTPAPGAPAPIIACPGLAPGWSTSEPVGEALLPAADAGAAGAVMMGGDVSFS